MSVEERECAECCGLVKDADDDSVEAESARKADDTCSTAAKA